MKKCYEKLLTASKGDVEALDRVEKNDRIIEDALSVIVGMSAEQMVMDVDKNAEVEAEEDKIIEALDNLNELAEEKGVPYIFEGGNIHEAVEFCMKERNQSFSSRDGGKYLQEDSSC